MSVKPFNIKTSTKRQIQQTHEETIKTIEQAIDQKKNIQVHFKEGGNTDNNITCTPIKLIDNDVELLWNGELCVTDTRNIEVHSIDTTSIKKDQVVIYRNKTYIVHSMDGEIATCFETTIDKDIYASELKEIKTHEEVYNGEEEHKHMDIKTDKNSVGDKGEDDKTNKPIIPIKRKRQYTSSKRSKSKVEVKSSVASESWITKHKKSLDKHTFNKIKAYHNGKKIRRKDLPVNIRMDQLIPITNPNQVVSMETYLKAIKNTSNAINPILKPSKVKQLDWIKKQYSKKLDEIKYYDQKHLEFTELKMEDDTVECSVCMCDVQQHACAKCVVTSAFDMPHVICSSCLLKSKVDILDQWKYGCCSKTCEHPIFIPKTFGNAVQGCFCDQCNVYRVEGNIPIMDILNRGLTGDLIHFPIYAEHQLIGTIFISHSYLVKEVEYDLDLKTFKSYPLNLIQLYKFKMNDIMYDSVRFNVCTTCRTAQILHTKQGDKTTYCDNQHTHCSLFNSIFNRSIYNKFTLPKIEDVKISDIAIEKLIKYKQHCITCDIELQYTGSACMHLKCSKCGTESCAACQKRLPFRHESIDTSDTVEDLAISRIHYNSRQWSKNPSWDDAQCYLYTIHQRNLISFISFNPPFIDHLYEWGIVDKGMCTDPSDKTTVCSRKQFQICCSVVRTVIKIFQAWFYSPDYRTLIDLVNPFLPKETFSIEDDGRTVHMHIIIYLICCLGTHRFNKSLETRSFDHLAFPYDLEIDIFGWFLSHLKEGETYPSIRFIVTMDKSELAAIFKNKSIYNVLNKNKFISIMDQWQEHVVEHFRTIDGPEQEREIVNWRDFATHTSKVGLLGIEAMDFDTILTTEDASLIQPTELFSFDPSIVPDEHLFMVW